MFKNNQTLRKFFGAITLIALAIIITTLAPLAHASSPTAIAPERTAVVKLEQPSFNQALSPDSQQLAQVTSISGIRDVSPSDDYYYALQNLVERYNCVSVYPDGTYRGNRALTRGDFAIMLEGCLNRVMEVVAAQLNG
ncbi:S-layer homology domain-containing protein [Phormidium sp. CCY1219]|uniref:S-layer homology domain-containing protein n=1 Tax=Phormidium sp. CCY1219 TaxID=2886104 RepID=UPI002D1F35BD|nr:S-layer homology domain-containing protein [Phormidium sp. CCY1219]MEB3826081.1 S-layer homology domain-containing protein [Phormidium sp. CCY1219]